MTPDKTAKELAFLYDLFVATDWDQAFALVIDEHVKLPQQGLAAYLEVGTGGHAITLQQRRGKKLKILGVDENAECIELAKAKAKAANAEVEFRRDNPEALGFKANQFDLVIGNASLVSPQRLTGMFREILRIAKPEARVALVLPTAPSFGEFFSLYWEALHNLGLADHEGAVERLIAQLPTISGVEEMAEREGLEKVESRSQVLEFPFESGEGFLNAPLISDFVMKEWLVPGPDFRKERVTAEIVRLIDEERHDAEFLLTVKATLIMGQKARSN